MNSQALGPLVVSMRRPMRWATAAILLRILVAQPAAAQTFLATQAINVPVCGSFLGLITQCDTIQTNRVSRSFTNAKLGTPLFQSPWSNASHCTRVDSTQAQCQASVAVTVDQAWSRIIWGRSNVFLLSYGKIGTDTGQFLNPRGVALTQRSGQWHVAFVADAGNNRVDAIALGYTCQCEKWLGSLNGSESGQRLSMPYDVAWDPATTWTMADDRLFILDTGNNRVLVYQVSLTFPNDIPTMTAHYVGKFGSFGAGPNNLSGPMGIAVKTTSSGGLLGNVYIADTRNHRVSLWYYDTPNTSVPDTSTFSAYRSAAFPHAAFVGITADWFDDVYVTDVSENLIWKLQGTTSSALHSLAKYGGQAAWANGNLIRPVDAEISYNYTEDVVGNLVIDGLPYLNVTEQWGDTSGVQLARMGVNADSLTAVVPNAPGSESATISWLMTSTGTYTVSITTLAGSVVRTYPSVVALAGWASQVWDGKNGSGTLMPYGTYLAKVATESGYTYDSGQPRTASQSFTFSAPISVGISGPSTVTENTQGRWTATASGGTSPYTYQWKKGTTVVGTASTYTFTPTTCTPFTLTLVVTDTHGYQNTNSLDVAITGGNPPCAQ